MASTSPRTRPAWLREIAATSSISAASNTPLESAEPAHPVAPAKHTRMFIRLSPIFLPANCLLSKFLNKLSPL